jgi:two-component system, chemotaxis family, chemotaxis protein CheY
MSTKDKIKVMIVDDSVIIRQMIKKYLSELNIEIVGTAGDGKSAIQLFKETQPDVVTLDITMPKVDGFTVLEEMVKENSKSKIMVITALTDKATGMRAIKTGAKGYLSKPFTPEKLRSSFDRLISVN